MLPLEQGWADPPLLAKTRVWWWWLNGNTDKPTITRDLEAMKANGLGGANVIDAGGDTQEGNQGVPQGPDFGSPEWRELFHHAVAEAGRLGLELGFSIQSGWNLGGPKVTAAQSSKKVTFSKTSVQGGTGVEMKLPEPLWIGGIYQDVAVMAVPLKGENAAVFQSLRDFKPSGHGTSQRHRWQSGYVLGKWIENLRSRPKKIPTSLEHARGRLLRRGAFQSQRHVVETGEGIHRISQSLPLHASARATHLRCAAFLR